MGRKKDREKDKGKWDVSLENSCPAHCQSLLKKHVNAKETCHKTVNKLIKKTGDSPHRQECEIMHYQLSAFPKIENDQTMEMPRPSRPCGDKPSEIRNK